MSKAIKKSSVLKEEKNDVLSSEIERSLLIDVRDDDFVWIEETTSGEFRKDNLHVNFEVDAETVNIAQRNTESDEFQIDNAEDTENSTSAQADWERELLVEQQYLEQLQKANSSRPKYPASQRLTVRQINNIANAKTIDRDPSYYKFDVSTTNTLKWLRDEKYVGPYHNIVGKGKHSVVFHASNPENGKLRVSYSCGNAVKVYKLSNDVKKNNAILKRAQKEYEHLLLLQRHAQNVQTPYILHKMRNILIFGFIGVNQETSESIMSLPAKHFKDLYQTIVKNLEIWYTKLNLVHGNLCTKNMLFELTQPDWSYNYPYFLCYIIGWGHSVRRDHPRALIKLMRDCYFVTNFFKRRDVPVKSAEELFKGITGLDKISSKVLDVINKNDLWQKGLLTNPNRQAQGS